MANNTFEGNQHFNNIQTLNTYLTSKIKDLPQIVQNKCTNYIQLRLASTWTAEQIDELILMCRYEHTVQMTGSTLDSFTEEELQTDKGQKRFLNLTRAINASLRDIAMLKSALGLTVAQIFGDKRALSTASKREMNIRDITPQSSVVELQDAREMVKRMLTS